MHRFIRGEGYIPRPFRAGLLIALIFTVSLFTSNLFGQSQGPGIRMLDELLNNGTVTLTAAGNGDSSGFAVEGVISNTTENRININVNIKDGIYLKNSGAGQNMVAVQVFLYDGRYYSDGSSYFIIIQPRGSISVVFNAFCANFDLDNPSSSQSFSISSMPANIMNIASRMGKFAVDNFDSDMDYTAAMQLALWRVQGHTRTEIFRKFDFDDDDWDLSAKIMSYM